MKKILSVVLAVMMLFSVMSISASAEDVFVRPDQPTSKQCIVSFDFNGGVAKIALDVFDPTAAGNGFVSTDGVTGIYKMYPHDKDDQVEGDYVFLPSVTAPSGSQFVGWQCTYGVDYGKIFAGGTPYTIPAGSAGTMIQFRAFYEAAEVEADTLDTVMGILIKVFGAIIGILMYGGNTEAGVAMMEKVLGGLLG